MDRIPKPGECYRHFKNKLYQVITVAEHTETSEKMVVYQALYGTFGTYVRPLSMFLSEVDHEKYPEALQKYRFERVEPGKNEEVMEAGTEAEPEEREEPCEEPIMNKNLLAFLDAESYHEKLEVLRSRKSRFKPEELRAICEILEAGNLEASVEEQYYSVERFLETQMKYDGARLR